MRMLWVLVGTLAACGHGKGGGPVDAHEGGERGVVLIDAPEIRDAVSTIDAPPGAGNARSHVIFVNTEGVTVTMGNDDATTNTSTIPTMASVTLTAFRAAD